VNLEKAELQIFMMQFLQLLRVAGKRRSHRHKKQRGHVGGEAIFRDSA